MYYLYIFNFLIVHKNIFKMCNRTQFEHLESIHLQENVLTFHLDIYML